MSLSRFKTEKDRRLMAAAAALQIHNGISQESAAIEGAVLGATDEAVTDLLTDLTHFIGQRNYHPVEFMESCMRMAVANYTAETKADNAEDDQ